MATQADSGSTYTAEYRRILRMATRHLQSQPIPAFLLDEVIITSSKEATQESLEEAYAKISAMVTDDALKQDTKAAIPMSWWKLLDALRESPMVTIEEVKKMWSKIKGEQTGNDSLSSKDIDFLKTILGVLKHLNEQKKQELEARLPKKKAA